MDPSGYSSRRRRHQRAGLGFYQRAGEQLGFQLASKTAPVTMFRYARDVQTSISDGRYCLAQTGDRLIPYRVGYILGHLPLGTTEAQCARRRYVCRCRCLSFTKKLFTLGLSVPREPLERWIESHVDSAPLPLLVPDQQKAEFVRFLTLSDAEASALQSGLESARPTSLLRALVDQLPDVHIDRDTLLEIVNVLISIEASRPEDELVDDFVAELIDTARSQVPELDARTWTNAAARLARVLSTRTLQLSAKASSLAWERPLVYYGARMLTDLRPIFLGEPDADPDAFVLTQSLRVEVWDRSEQRKRAIFIALEPDDLEDLEAVIERARSKKHSLQNYCERRQVLCINGAEDEDEAS